MLCLEEKLIKNNSVIVLNIAIHSITWYNSQKQDKNRKT